MNIAPMPIAPLLSAGLLCLVACVFAQAATTTTTTATTATTAPTSQPFQSYVLDFTTPTDAALQSKIERIDFDLRTRYGMQSDQAAVGLLDLVHLHLAMIRPDAIDYAASVPKVGILLAYFTLHPEAANNLDPQTRHELGLMAKQSNNEMASKFSHEMGLVNIQKVLNDAGFYDKAHGGGIWVGKHYGKDSERHGDPIGDHSHAATVRQLLRYFLLLEQGKLVSPQASKTMREIFESPDLAPDDIKFVHALKDRPGMHIIRKWGTWEDWHHDCAVVTAPGRHYILIGMTRHPRGDEYLEDLARAVDDLVMPVSP